MNKLIFFGVFVLVLAAVVQADVVWHDPWLNWDFINQLPPNIIVDDLDIWVDNPNWNPQQWWANPFPNMTVMNNAGDIDGDGDMDTRIRYWGGGAIPSNGTAHGGLYMLGSGMVLDAYWTSGGQKVGPSTPVTYERTRIVGDPAVFMELSFGAGFFLDPENAGREAGWTNIRTFVNIPADVLDLADLNSSLDLSTLAAYEVTPRAGGADGPVILPTDVFLMNNPGPDSFFDVFLADIDPEFANSGYEALLVAQVVATGSAPIPTGMFWNLNPQSPEPATVMLIALGSLMIRKRRQ